METTAGSPAHGAEHSQGVTQSGGVGATVDGCVRCAWLELELERVTKIAADQAKALAELTDESPPWAPTVAYVYWRYSLARGSEPGWRKIWNRLKPLVSALGDLPAPKLTPAVWAEYRAQRKREPTVKTKKGPCDHTLNLELGRAKEMLSWAVQGEMLKFSPLEAAKRVKTKSRRGTALPSDAIDRLLEAADDFTDGRLAPEDDDDTRSRILRAFSLCCYESMLRFHEALYLRRDRVDHERYATVIGKGSKVRIVRLTERTLEALEAIPAPPGCQPYFVRPSGKPMASTTLSAWFRRLCKLADVDPLVAPGDVQLKPHDLRRSGATEADLRGARVTAIRDTLGHSTLATTEVYVTTDKRESARHIGEVMDRRPAKRAGKKRRGPLKSTRPPK